MNKKNIISITGKLASGKGTVSKILMEELNYEVYRNGAYVRKLAANLNMDINEFNKYLEHHPEIDREIESSASKYASDHDNFIIDARLGWYAVPYSFKVFLDVDINISAQRAFNDALRKDTESFKNVEEQKKAIIERRASETLRYKELYGIDQNDFSNYDLVIDTSNKTPSEVASIIKEAYFKWKEEK